MYVCMYASSKRTQWRHLIHEGANELQQSRITEEETRRAFRKATEAEHIQLLRRDDGFKCSHCPRVFPKNSSLKRHVTVKHTVRPSMELKCRLCQRVFGTRSAKTRHRCTAPGAVVLTCPKCSKQCKSRSGLTRHTQQCKNNS